MVKKTFWTKEQTQKEYFRETFTHEMILLAETHNLEKDKFPENPKKEVIVLDVNIKVASVKLIAYDWIDHVQIVKLKGK